MVNFNNNLNTISTSAALHISPDLKLLRARSIKISSNAFAIKVNAINKTKLLLIYVHEKFCGDPSAKLKLLPE